METKVQELFTKKEVDHTVKKFLKESNLSEEEQEAFDKEFKEISEGKKLDESNIDKYLRLAFIEAVPSKDYKSVEKDAKDMAVSRGSQTESKQVQHNARKSNIEYLKSQ
jgi:hypothetical protein